ncbi:hypothetical protein H8R20_11660 [Morganella morganii]|nr:hypothetical protein [Morganella morganii]
MAAILRMMPEHHTSHGGTRNPGLYFSDATEHPRYVQDAAAQPEAGLMVPVMPLSAPDAALTLAVQGEAKHYYSDYHGS